MENEIQLKMFVVVPKRPHMSRGKVASQVAHATFMALELQRDIEITQCIEGKNDDNGSIIENWKHSGMCVIVLECPSQVELMGIAKYCEQWKIPHYIYIDEGATEISMGTATAFATGVLSSDKHWIFSQLKLFTDESLFHRMVKNKQ